MKICTVIYYETERQIQHWWSTIGVEQLALPMKAGKDFTEEFSFEFSLSG